MKKFIFPALLIFIIPNLVFSQQKIDLNEAIRTALSNSPSIETIKNNLQIQKYNTKSTKGDLFPYLSFSAGWNRSHTFSKGGIIYQNGIPIAISDQDITQDNFNLSMNANVTLFDGFANYESVDLENENERSLRLILEREKNGVVITVSQYFFDVLKKEQIVKTNEDNLAESISQLEKIKEYFNVGKITMADVYKQEVQVAQDELSLERAKNDFKKAKVDLLFAMNDDINKEYDMDSKGIESDLSEADLKLILENSSDIDKLVKNAINNRYDYKTGLQDIKISKTKLSIAKKYLYYPTLTAFGNFNLSGTDVREITDTRVAGYGLTLSYPIFQGFNLDVSEQIAEVNLKQKSEDLKLIDIQIKSEIKKSVLDLETAYKQIEILETNIVSAEQDKLLSEESYRVGLATILDVQTANTKLNNLRLEKINAIYNFLISKMLIDYYTGQLKY
ncbi:MAG: TolC family protein [Ignavibacteria bacterium]|nr:TolC family protein [Ignavibacteria bacterium]